MTEPQTTDLERRLLGAELALGLLDHGERAGALALFERDEDFRAEVAYWQSKADSWLEGLPPKEPGSDLWPAIEREIDLTAPDGDTGGLRGTGQFGWAVAASLAAVLALTAAAFLYSRNQDWRAQNASLSQRVAAAESERRMAQMVNERGGTSLSAVYDPASGQLKLRVNAGPVNDRVPELWIIPADGTPRSLGVFQSARSSITVPSAIRTFMQDGATLAVTLEPLEGAPHAAPSGPIVGSTELKSI